MLVNIILRDGAQLETVAGTTPAHIFLHCAKFCEILFPQTSTWYLPSASSATVCFTLKNHPSLNALGGLRESVYLSVSPGPVRRRKCPDLFLPLRHRGHVELFLNGLSQSRGSPHGTRQCEPHLQLHLSRSPVRFRNSGLLCLDEKRKWLSLGCESL